jgi:hypothetical protein
MEFNAEKWAIDQFKYCELGDNRRTERLIKMSSRLGAKIGGTISSVCIGDDAALEGGYRFIRNPQIKPQAIRDGVSKKTVEDLGKYSGDILSIEDTTTFSYQHRSSLRDLGSVGAKVKGKSKRKTKGMLAHTALLYSAEKNKTIGIVEQTFWKRPEESTREERKNRAYEDKESYIWEETSRKQSTRLGEAMSRVISVCDREADIYDYLNYKRENNQRFIVRGYQKRTVLKEKSKTLYEVVEEADVIGKYTVEIAQRSGRKKRTAEIEVRCAQVKVSPPKKKMHKDEIKKEPLEWNVILAKEINAEDTTGISWLLFTSESIADFDSCCRVIKYYAKRWHIEEFHKAWKSGAGAERARMQSADNLERMVTILGVIAVRLIQLREAISQPEEKAEHCTEVLTEKEYKMLSLFAEKNIRKKTPPEKHTIKWAYETIAKIGGWANTKRTGVASWQTIWNGWLSLQDQVDVYNLLLSVQKL